MVTRRKETSDYGITAADIDGLRAAQSELATLNYEIRTRDRAWLEDTQADIRHMAGAVTFNLRNAMPSAAVFQRPLFESPESAERTAAVTRFLTEQFIAQLKPLREFIARLEAPVSVKDNR